MTKIKEDLNFEGAARIDDLIFSPFFLTKHKDIYNWKEQLFGIVVD